MLHPGREKRIINWQRNTQTQFRYLLYYSDAPVHRSERRDGSEVKHVEIKWQMCVILRYIPSQILSEFTRLELIDGSCD